MGEILNLTRGNGGEKGDKDAEDRYDFKATTFYFWAIHYPGYSERFHRETRRKKRKGVELTITKRSLKGVFKNPKGFTLYTCTRKIPIKLYYKHMVRILQLNVSTVRLGKCVYSLKMLKI